VRRLGRACARHRGVVLVEIAQYEIGIRHRGFCAALAIGDGPGTAPALRGPTCSVPLAPTEPIEPPPAPSVTMSRLPARCALLPRCGHGQVRPRIQNQRDISEVPPTSKVMRFCPMRAAPELHRPRRRLPDRIARCLWRAARLPRQADTAMGKDHEDGAFVSRISQPARVAVRGTATRSARHRH